MLMNSVIKLTNELIINYLSAKALVFTYHIKHLGELLIYKQIYAATCSQFQTLQFASSLQETSSCLGITQLLYTFPIPFLLYAHISETYMLPFCVVCLCLHSFLLL